MDVKGESKKSQGRGEPEAHYKYTASGNQNRTLFQTEDGFFFMSPSVRYGSTCMAEWLVFLT